MPAGQPGIWHITSRCVRRQRLLTGEDARSWLCDRFAAWLEVLAVDLLGYAFMDNHIHLVIRTRPDVARSWPAVEVRRRQRMTASVSDGRPVVDLPQTVAFRGVDVDLAEARDQLSHPGSMLRAVKEGFARRLNRQDRTAGHVWESRYHDVAVIDAGGVLACLVYVDLNPFRAGVVTDPTRSDFCSSRHRLRVDAGASDAVLGRKLCRLSGHPLLTRGGGPAGTVAVTSAQVAELTAATALQRRGQGAVLPSWSTTLFLRLGIAKETWGPAMSRAGTIAGSVVGSYATRSLQAGEGRMSSDKTGLFALMEDA